MSSTLPPRTVQPDYALTTLSGMKLSFIHSVSGEDPSIVHDPIVYGYDSTVDSEKNGILKKYDPLDKQDCDAIEARMKLASSNLFCWPSPHDFEEYVKAALEKAGKTEYLEDTESHWSVEGGGTKYTRGMTLAEACSHLSNLTEVQQGKLMSEDLTYATQDFTKPEFRLRLRIGGMNTEQLQRLGKLVRDDPSAIDLVDKTVSSV